jgi:hypothetical protein
MYPEMIDLTLYGPSNASHKQINHTILLKIQGFH